MLLHCTQHLFRSTVDTREHLIFPALDIFSVFETSAETDKQSFYSGQLAEMVGGHFGQNGQNLNQNSQNSVAGRLRGGASPFFE